jgi:hypothetical protein
VQPQALGHAGKAVATHQLRRRKTRSDALHQRLQAGGAAGEVQRVQVLRRQPGLARGFAGGVDDVRQVGFQRLGGVGPRAA